MRYIHQNPVKAGIVNQPVEWKWSSCSGYYGHSLYPVNMLDDQFVLKRLSSNTIIARERFKDFNERKNKDKCLDEPQNVKRLSDEQARSAIKEPIRKDRDCAS